MIPIVDDAHKDLLVITDENGGENLDEAACGVLLQKETAALRDPRILDEWGKATAAWGNGAKKGKARIFTKLPREWLTHVWAKVSYHKEHWFRPGEGETGALVSDHKLDELLMWGPMEKMLAKNRTALGGQIASWKQGKLKKMHQLHRLSQFVFSRIVADLAEIDPRDVHNARRMLPESEWNAAPIQPLRERAASKVTTVAAPSPVDHSTPAAATVPLATAASESDSESIAQILLMKRHLSSSSLTKAQRESLLALIPPGAALAWASQADVSRILIGPQAVNLVRAMESSFQAEDPHVAQDIRWCPDLSNVHQGLHFDEPVVTVGIRWANAEAYFQSRKFTWGEDICLFRADLPGRKVDITPMEAYNLGQKARLPADWKKQRLPVMLKALRAKLAAAPHLADVLLATGRTSKLVQFKNDSFWGSGEDGKGKNMLGKLWEILRAEEQVKKDQVAAAAAASGV
jgi:ribA/ribD-fused uncharacterized protein